MSEGFKFLEDDWRKMNTTRQAATLYEWSQMYEWSTIEFTQQMVDDYKKLYDLLKSKDAVIHHECFIPEGIKVR